MRTLHSVLFAAVLTAIGCTGSAQVHTTAEADYVAPQLIEVEPGVQVVADYDQPVFYSDGMYWRSEGGIWYSSRYHNHAWVRVQAPPVAVAHVEHPEIYVHYHGKAEVRQERVDHDMNRVGHDQNEVNHDQNETAHDRDEIRHDEANGHEHEAKHDEKELAHDQKEQAKDERKEMKDEKKAAKDERKEEKHEHKH